MLVAAEEETVKYRDWAVNHVSSFLWNLTSNSLPVYASEKINLDYSRIYNANKSANIIYKNSFSCCCISQSSKQQKSIYYNYSVTMKHMR